MLINKFSLSIMGTDMAALMGTDEMALMDIDEVVLTGTDEVVIYKRRYSADVNEINCE